MHQGWADSCENHGPLAQSRAFELMLFSVAGGVLILSTPSI